MGQAQIIGEVMVFFSMLASVVSMLIDYWCFIHVHKEDITESLDYGYALYFGLWNRCRKYEKAGHVVTECKTWFSYRVTNEISLPWLQICQVMMIFGTWLYCSAFLAGLVCIKINQQTRVVAYMSGLGGLCCLVATAVFAAKRGSLVHPTHGQDFLQAGFGLAVSAGLFGIIASYFLWRHSVVPGYQNIDVF